MLGRVKRCMGRVKSRKLDPGKPLIRGWSDHGSGRVRHCMRRVRSGQIKALEIGSGRVQTLAGRVGSEKLDPGTNLCHHQIVSAILNDLLLLQLGRVARQGCRVPPPQRSVLSPGSECRYW